MASIALDCVQGSWRSDDLRRCQRRPRSDYSIDGHWSEWSKQEIEAIIDTGFTGFLTLPSAIVTTLGLPWLSRQPGILADGSVDIFDVHVGEVVWDGQIRAVEIEVANTEPLVGMSLLMHYSLRIDIVSGGVVTITAIPSCLGNGSVQKKREKDMGIGVSENFTHCQILRNLLSF